MLTNKQKITVIITALLLLLTIFLWWYIFDINNQNTTYSPTEESSRGFDTSENDISILQLDNPEVFEENFNSVGATILNQIYQKRYESDGYLEKLAHIDNQIKKDNNKYSFSLRFLPSEQVYDIDVQMKHTDTKDYDITVKKR